jgi:hypothetical protein
MVTRTATQPRATAMKALRDEEGEEAGGIGCVEAVVALAATLRDLTTLPDHARALLNTSDRDVQ